MTFETVDDMVQWIRKNTDLKILDPTQQKDPENYYNPQIIKKLNDHGYFSRGQFRQKVGILFNQFICKTCPVENKLKCLLCKKIKHIIKEA